MYDVRSIMKDLIIVVLLR